MNTTEQTAVSITRKRAIETIKSTKKIYSVEFIKKNGEKRKMVCRQGVSKGVKGTGMSWDPSERGYITTFDMHKGAYRMINVNTIQSIKANGQKFKIK